jgi:hypothetical protein
LLGLQLLATRQLKQVDLQPNEPSGFRKGSGRMSHRPTHPTLLLCLSLALLNVITNAEDPKTARKAEDDASSASFESVLNLDVTGRPNMTVADGTKVYIWHDGDGWHFRTNAANKRKKNLVNFTGTIQVDAGRVTKLDLIGGLEGKGKKKDSGWISPEKKTIKFDFTTAGKGEDGFDFQVTGLTKAIRFDVRVGGYDHPNLVVLGGAKQPAPGGRFVLQVPKAKE